MKKKDVVFTIGLTIFMGVLWIVGEIVMGLWLAVVPKTHLWWFIGIVAATLTISVWHSMIEDESDLKDPKREKDERKISKRKKKRK